MSSVSVLMDTPRLTMVPDRDKMFAGESVILTCSVNNAFPAPTITWWKSAAFGFGGTKLKREATEYITEATREYILVYELDRHDNNKYLWCQGNQRGQISKASRSKQIRNIQCRWIFLSVCTHSNGIVLHDFH